MRRKNQTARVHPWEMMADYWFQNYGNHEDTTEDGRYLDGAIPYGAGYR